MTSGIGKHNIIASDVMLKPVRTGLSIAVSSIPGDTITYMRQESCGAGKSYIPLYQESQLFGCRASRLVILT